MNRKTPMPPADDVRETPPDLFAALDHRFAFTLDVCATSGNAKLPRFFTEAQDGLKQSWAGERVWCNPPFSNIVAWVEKAWDSGAELVVMLVPATRTEQAWWQELIEPARDGRIPDMLPRLRTEFLRGRTRFLKDGKQMGSPKFGCVLLIWER